MRGKRSKQYRKLMQQYGLTFGFREPYQVLVDAEMIHDARRFAMDLPVGLARTLHGNVKVMITSCSIRHLFALPTLKPPVHGDSAEGAAQASTAPAPAVSSDAVAFLTTPVAPQMKTDLLQISRTLTLRKCGHHELATPLAPFECLRTVLDPKGNGVNKHRLVLAAQDAATRHWARRSVRGVPSIYVKRSVMIMEPMSDLSQRVRAGEEIGKLQGSRMMESGTVTDSTPLSEPGAEVEESTAIRAPAAGGRAGAPATKESSKKRKRVKGPNPLSVKKKKPKVAKLKV